MAEEDKPKRAKDSGSYTVTSGSRSSGKTVTFNVPTIPKPRIKGSEKYNRSHAFMAIAFIIIIFLSAYFGAWLQSHNSSQNPLVGGSLSTQKKIVTSQSQLISEIAKTVGPSVVSVNVSITSSTPSQSSFFGFAQPTQEQAAGTGIILTSDGLIMTNRHVVPAGTTNVSITLSDGTELKNVSVLGRTSDTDTLDVAFLKVNDLKGHKLTPAVIGDSSNVQVGDSVVAIGNALGQFQNTVTSGIISGYGRSVQAGDSSGASSSTESLDNLFQTDAAINEGNSGGPLVNMNGQVIGMNTAIASNSQNIGFAIPVNDIKGLIEQVVKTGKFTRPYLGVEFIPLTADVANQYGLSVTNGAFIAPSSDPTNSPSVIPGSPAESAGLKVNDVITQVNGVNIDQNHSLTSLLNSHQPGDKVTLTVVNGNSTRHVEVTLGTKPAS